MHPYPRNYHAAMQRLEAGDLRTRAVDGGIAVYADGIPLVTFYADGRVKVCTYGKNWPTYIQLINSILPPRYRLRKRKSANLCLVDKYAKRTLCKFLSSTIFTPEPETEAVPC